MWQDIDDSCAKQIFTKKNLLRFSFQSLVMDTFVIFDFVSKPTWNVMHHAEGGRKDKVLPGCHLVLVGVDHLKQLLELLKVALLHHPVGLVDGQVPDVPDTGGQVALF